MAVKITRITQNPFGTSGPVGDFIAFGSKALNPSSPIFTQNPATIQSLAPFSEGWAQAIIGSYEPTLEDMNGLWLLAFYQLGYLLQEGLAEYDAGTNYFINSMCQYNGVIYQSLTNSNLGNEPDTNPSSWQCIDANAFGGAVASASSITLPNTGNCFKISGTTNINSITILPAGTTIELIFTGSLTVNTGGNILLNLGAFNTSANATLVLLSDGSNWYEVSRSPATGNASWTTFNAGQIYQAAVSGTIQVSVNLIGSNSGNAAASIVTDSSPTPTTVRAQAYLNINQNIATASVAPMTCRVKKGDYYEVQLVTNSTVAQGPFFLPDG